MPDDKPWRVIVPPTARRDLARVPSTDRERTQAAIDALAADPFKADIRKLRGMPDEWRLRVGRWRIRFRPDTDTRTVVITRILPRDRSYRE